ncbi:MAG: pantoate--beta-alanine ligase [Dysgonamonadaceae bacterium]|nr:pantoate--beta-alanine ligase [Dysgonamonadaceae bacterium]
MKLIHTIAGLQTVLAQEKGAKKSIGFVPTMGALHPGHIELVKRAVAGNDVSVVSIFVNPNQFNNPDDLLNYPRTLAADCERLEAAAADIAFVPEVEEIYPEPDRRRFHFGSLETVMEGRFRPGHFNGVAQVVSRLFDIVKPDRAYFGEKDFQQLAIVRALVEQLALGIEIVACPIVREEGGLAMSSRNARLTATQRERAACIFKTLSESDALRGSLSVRALEQWVVSRINAVAGLEVEYFDIVDGCTLQPLNGWADTNCPVGCIAVYAGDVRLIDNIVYGKNPVSIF